MAASTSAVRLATFCLTTLTPLQTVPTHLRATYQVDKAVTSPYAHLRQYVVSSTMEVEDPAVELVTGDPLGLVRRLKEEDGLDIYLCGGGKPAGALLPEIDELIIKCYPVVAGAGIPAFDGEFRPTVFTLTGSKTYNNGAVVMT
ncbi:dihydrofolate reductase family protein [Nonomuraea sp. NPDC003201]